jgi:putative FmdB family regulatory protein
MPTYDYECDACSHTFEIFQGINDPFLVKCPECGKKKLRRLFGTGAAIVFKGSGFYQTDYRSEGYKKAAAADKKSTEGGSSDSKSSDTKSKDAKPSTPKTESKSTTSKTPKANDS